MPRPGDGALKRPWHAFYPAGVPPTASYYAALRAGATVVASSPAIGEEECTSQLSDSAPRLVMGGGPGEGTPADPGPLDIAVLQYTSGTTGRPKAAIMSHGNLVSSALQNAWWFGRTDAEVNLAILPLCPHLGHVRVHEFHLRRRRDALARGALRRGGDL